MLRSVGFLVFLFLFSLLVGVLAFPALLRREWSLAVSKWWAGTNLAALRLFCGIDDRVLGAEHLPEGPALIAARHQSMWETLKLTTLLDRPSFVLKKELSRWPVFSWFCRANGFIFIDRKAGARSLRDMTEQARARIAEGAQVVIFPEGTRSRPGEHLPFQPGVAALARALGVPTVPVTHDSGRFWQQPGPIKKPGTITLEIFPPITDASNRKEFMRTLEDTIHGKGASAS